MGEVVGLLTLIAVAAVLLVLILAGLIAYEARRPPRHTTGYALGRGVPVDPGDLGLRFASWLLRRPGGVELPVWDVAGEGGNDGAADPITVVFVHGWGQSRVDLLARLAPWQSLATRLVLYDLRGHGDATGGLSDLGHGEEQDLLALLEALGEGPFVVSGYSMGAVIALGAAVSGLPPAARIGGIVAYGPYCEFHTSLQGRLRRAGLPARPMTDLALLWFRLRGLRPPSIGRRAASLRCPLLVFHGADDPVCPVDHARRIVADAPDGALIEVAGARHLDAPAIDPAGHDEALGLFVRRVQRR